MGKEGIIQKIIQALQENSDRKFKCELNGETTLFGDLRIDSLDLVLFLDELEEEYKFSVDVEEIEQFASIQDDIKIKDVATYIEHKLVN